MATPKVRHLAIAADPPEPVDDEDQDVADVVDLDEWRPPEREPVTGWEVVRLAAAYLGFVAFLVLLYWLMTRGGAGAATG